MSEHPDTKPLSPIEPETFKETWNTGVQTMAGAEFYGEDEPNQDGQLVTSAGGIMCDGMGSAKNSHLAVDITLNAMRSAIEPEIKFASYQHFQIHVTNIAEAASSRIRSELQGDPAATTVSLMRRVHVGNEEHIYGAIIGDSPMYALEVQRDGSLALRPLIAPDSIATIILNGFAKHAPEIKRVATIINEALDQISSTSYLQQYEDDANKLITETLESFGDDQERKAHFTEAVLAVRLKIQELLDTKTITHSTDQFLEMARENIAEESPVIPLSSFWSLRNNTYLLSAVEHPQPRFFDYTVTDNTAGFLLFTDGCTDNFTLDDIRRIIHKNTRLFEQADGAQQIADMYIEGSASIARQDKYRSKPDDMSVIVFLRSPWIEVGNSQ